MSKSRVYSPTERVAILKRYLVEKGAPFLRAENPLYPDLIPARELVIQGVFRALIRTHFPH